MRALGFALLALSVLLSAGGVGIRAAGADSIPAEADLHRIERSSEANTCQLPKTPTVRTVHIDVPARASKERRSAFALNTRGFNYTRPGELPALSPGSPYAPPSDQD